MRVSLPDLCRGGVDGRRTRHGPLRAGRQGDPAQVEGTDGRPGVGARRDCRGAGGEVRRRARHARPAGARHPGRRLSAEPSRIREGRAPCRVRPVDDRPHLRGGRQPGRLRPQEPAARPVRARSGRRNRRGDRGLRRRGLAAAPGAFEQGRHCPAERRLPDVPGDARLRRRGSTQAAGAGRGRRAAGAGRGRPSGPAAGLPLGDALAAGAAEVARPPAAAALLDRLLVEGASARGPSHRVGRALGQQRPAAHRHRFLLSRRFRQAGRCRAGVRAEEPRLRAAGR